jgi:hypothetical protein
MIKMTVPRGRSNNSKGVGNSSKGGHSAGRWSERLGRHIVYSGPVLFDLTITFLVVRSFTDKPNGLNFIDHQLLVVKRQIGRRL